jgi:hypothetical protein
MKRLQTALPDRLKRWFFLLLAANVLFIILARFYLHPLTTSEIIRFELAKDVGTAESIVEHWIAAGLLTKARNSVYLDFLFIILYTSGLSVASLLLSKLTWHEVLARTGYFMVYLLLAAGICDVIENVALLRSLHGTIENWNVILAYDMAATKFSILILCLLFCSVCVVFRLFRNV